ncbi:MAG: glycosyltransferase family 39 protein [candidate division Zixibacteria bacterium]|nr:glycosyltransferase family 39 protein [candidate division Zixibacteria bacterium]
MTNNMNYMLKAKSNFSYLIEEYPLTVVMTVAIALRVIAIFFSKGYIYTDDHFETVSVAYHWLQYGLWSPEGFLTWGGRTDPNTIARCPLYTLFLYGIMKVQLIFGVNSLDHLMYSIRAVHGLLSLISVYAIFKIVALVTSSKKWAVIGGLMLAAHFAVPTLSVRTLIEFVCSHFWLFALYLIYRYDNERSSRYLYILFWAGILSGLSWMIRFQIVFAVITVPVIFLWQYRRIREALWYSAGALTMVAIAGLLDYAVLGSFLSSTLQYLGMAIDKPVAVVKEPVWVYVAVLASLFIPPLSVVVFSMAGFKRFWERHRVLVFSSLVFILVHTAINNRQERFMMPIIPALMLIMVLVIWQQFYNNGYLSRHRKLFNSMAAFSVCLNLILLPIFTTFYGTKGMVEPQVLVERFSGKASIMFVSPEKKRVLYPNDYGGFGGFDRTYLNKWDNLKRYQSTWESRESFEYYVLYPNDADDLSRYVDSLEKYIGSMEKLYYVGPSTIDMILHILNPRHNPRDDAWVYRLVEKGDDLSNRIRQP